MANDIDPDADPYAEGADARLAGQDETRNPYDPDTQSAAYSSWFDGWSSIEEEDE